MPEKETWKLPEEWANQERPIPENLQMKRRAAWFVSFWLLLSSIAFVAILYFPLFSTEYRIAGTFIMIMYIIAPVIGMLVGGAVGDIWARDDEDKSA